MDNFVKVALGSAPTVFVMIESGPIPALVVFFATALAAVGLQLQSR